MSNPNSFQRTMGVDTDNFCKGLGNVCCNGTPIGLTKAGAAVTARLVSGADLDIEGAQYPGEILGVRRGGQVWELSITGMEVSLANLRRGLDLQGSASVSQLPIGRPQKVATAVQLTIYGEAPQQKTRRWTFHRAVLVNPEELLLAGDKEFSTAPMKFRVAVDVQYGEDWCYGIITDYA